MMQDRVLIICEMANNHMGDVTHGKLMIEQFSKVADSYRDTFDFAWKFQFRDLDTFIHKDYVHRDDLKYVKRFKETDLSQEQFTDLKNHAEKHGFLTMCTAFDEPSIARISEMNFDIAKVASCSFTDWPLLNELISLDIPIILSTAGATIQDIDNVVSFMQHRNKDFSLMHCVGQYPTDASNLQLNQISQLRDRYPNVRVGYSTHEHPSETRAISMAIAKGAVLAEKHVAVETDQYPINAYSVTPEQMDKWLRSASDALVMNGSLEKPQPREQELSDLGQFKRGVFVKRNIQSGEAVTRDDLYCAWPSVEGQFLANSMSKYSSFTVNEDLPEDSPLLAANATVENRRSAVWDIVQDVKSFLDESNVVYPSQADLEISHHYGVDHFYETGIAMITVVNRDYCKKLIIVLPNQNHPEQYHLKKEETFVVLHGELDLKLSVLTPIANSWPEIELSGHTLCVGDVITIEPEVRHEFSSKNGCVLEEVSSTHYADDSFYTDPSIIENRNRKTLVSYWK
jgi:sialic acid synthase SpsE/D-lyxose ketol-isomerase